MRTLVSSCVVLTLIFLLGCKKDQTIDETDLHGTWAKGSNHGDTVWFMKKNGQHIIRIPESFNPLMPVYSEKEYRFNNGVLSIKSFAPSSQEYFPITSFTWIDRDKEFSVQNSQLFMFMSSIITYRYRKIN